MSGRSLFDSVRADFIVISSPTRWDSSVPWREGLAEVDMGKWIAQRVARDFGFHGSDCVAYDDLMLEKYGVGRAKPVWAERIEKKYMWIALNQLGSRLHDHVEAERESWERVDGVTPSLILPRCRKLDPTIPVPGECATEQVAGWSVAKPADLETAGEIDFEEWLAARDVPTLKDVARSKDVGTRRVRPVTAYLSWYGVERGIEGQSLYRNLWANLQGFLVGVDEIQRAYRGLAGRDLLDIALPRSSRYTYGFAGEYPWGVSFAVDDEEEEQSLVQSPGGKLRVSAKPAWAEIVSEWEYDVSRADITIHVPAKQLLDRQARWNGSGSFVGSDGEVIFDDPSFRGAGPPALLADERLLREWLEAGRQGLVLVWFGQKLVHSHDMRRLGHFLPRTFSQVGYLDYSTGWHASRLYWSG